MSEIKILIDVNGCLQLRKGSKLAPQYCPYANTNLGRTLCGAWCPLFEETHYDFDVVALNVCMKTFRVEKGEFQDDRL
jgi:hypothetical protein